MLDASLAAQLKSLLEKVVQPIELVSSLDDSKKSTELNELLEEIGRAFGPVRPLSEPGSAAPAGPNWSSSTSTRTRTTPGRPPHGRQNER